MIPAKDIRTEQLVSAWIFTNLGPIIRDVLQEEKAKKADLIYTEDWLGGIAHREVKNLIVRHGLGQHPLPFRVICEKMVGDYSQREGELRKQYHGYSFWQIDTGSYPDFISSGQWKDPKASCRKAIAVLEEKRRYLKLQPHWLKIDQEARNRAVTAAYNCGQGNVAKTFTRALPVDFYTHGGDYSAFVWEYRKLYRQNLQ